MTFLKESVMETLVKEIRQCVAGLSGCHAHCFVAGFKRITGYRGGGEWSSVKAVYELVLDCA